MTEVNEIITGQSAARARDPRTNITRNAWYLRLLGHHTDAVLHDVEAPHTDEWARPVGQLAVGSGRAERCLPRC